MPTVKSGDTLKKIAAANGVTLAALIAANPQITDPDLIHPGDVVNLPGGEPAAASAPSPTPPATNTAPTVSEPGDQDWQFLALRFEQVFGYRPWAGASTDDLLRNIGIREPEWEDAARDFINVYGYAPWGGADVNTVQSQVRGALPKPSPPPAVPQPTPIPQPTPGPGDPEPLPDPEPVDFRARAAALYPFLPSVLLDLFADAWSVSGDPNLALAEVRQAPQYDQLFPGIRRDDGSLRMTESEYLGRVEGYKLAYQQFNLNPSIFESHMVELIEGGVSAQQFANRLSSAYSEIVSALPEVKEFYAANFGFEMSDEAIFASFIDPDISDAVLNKQIAVSQIGGAGAAQGFNVDLDFATSIQNRGVGFSGAQEFFGSAARNIPVLDTLARRFGVDKTVDLNEFAAGVLFGDPLQARRFERLRSRETSSFTDRLATLSTGEDFQVQGLSQR